MKDLKYFQISNKFILISFVQVDELYYTVGLFFNILPLIERSNANIILLSFNCMNVKERIAVFTVRASSYSLA